ncbi:MAG: RNA-processing protein [Candidatus Heimdallarchaeota archaeon]|nr:RNA-processing protein [Candidatus Heimdallarchaeota archaeon]
MNMNSDQSPNPDESPLSYESSQFIRIPMKRIGAVIGKKGANREEIEKATSSKIIIDSDTGEVEIRPDSDLKDPVMLIKASEIVKAIGRGFYYKTALKLIEDDYYLDIIRLKQNIGKSGQQIRRVKSRIIGTGGKTRKMIEELTSTHLVISGSTVSLIGMYDKITLAHDAVSKIIAGSPIESVLKKLEEKKKEEQKAEKQIWKDSEEIEQEKLLKEEEEDIFEDYEEE